MSEEPDSYPAWTKGTRRDSLGAETMRLRHIEVFRAVILTGSISKAALLLHVSQPVVSRILQHAERTVGFPLFTRGQGKLIATPEALDIYPDVERIFAELERLRTKTSNLLRNGPGMLRIAAIPSFVQSLLPGTIERIRHSNPQAQFDLVSLHTSEMVGALRDRSIDVGIALATTPAAGIEASSVAFGELVLATPAAWPVLIEHDTLASELEMFRERPFIRLDDLTPLGSLIGQRLRLAGFSEASSISVQTYSIARALTAQGLGYAAIDHFTAVAGVSSELQIYKIRPKIEFDVAVLTRSDGPASRLIGELKGALRAEAESASNLLEERASRGCILLTE